MKYHHPTKPEAPNINLIDTACYQGRDHATTRSHKHAHCVFALLLFLLTAAGQGRSAKNTAILPVV